MDPSVEAYHTGEHVQRHLGGDARHGLHQEVGCSHPRLDRAEGVFDRLATHAHLPGVRIKSALHGFEEMLVLPAGDTPLRARRAVMVDRACAADIGPIAAVRFGKQRSLRLAYRAAKARLGSAEFKIDILAAPCSKIDQGLWHKAFAPCVIKRIMAG